MTPHYSLTYSITVTSHKSASVLLYYIFLQPCIYSLFYTNVRWLFYISCTNHVVYIAQFLLWVYAGFRWSAQGTQRKQCMNVFQTYWMLLLHIIWALCEVWNTWNYKLFHISVSVQKKQLTPIIMFDKFHKPYIQMGFCECSVERRGK